MADRRTRSRGAIAAAALISAVAFVGAPAAHAAETAGTVVTWGSNTYG